MSLLLSAVLFAPLFAATKAQRAGFQDGWKWYLHRKSQGAPDTELLDILRTMRKKYGATDLDMSRVTQALSYYERKTNSGKTASKPKANLKKSKGQSTAPASAAKVKSMAKPTKFVAEKSTAETVNKPDKSIVRQRVRDLRNPDEATRIAAAQELGDWKAEEAVDDLVRLLGDESTFVSVVAADSLSRIGGPAFRALVGALDHRRSQVRISACVALGETRRDDAVPYLKGRLQDKDARVREAAQTAIDTIRSREIDALAAGEEPS